MTYSVISGKQNHQKHPNNQNTPTIYITFSSTGLDSIFSLADALDKDFIPWIATFTRGSTCLLAYAKVLENVEK